MVRIGIIGFGYWGPQLTRNFSSHKQARVVAVSDLLGRETRGSPGSISKPGNNDAS